MMRKIWADNRATWQQHVGHHPAERKSKAINLLWAACRAQLSRAAHRIADRYDKLEPNLAFTKLPTI